MQERSETRQSRPIPEHEDADIAEITGGTGRAFSEAPVQESVEADLPAASTQLDSLSAFKGMNTEELLADVVKGAGADEEISEERKAELRQKMLETMDSSRMNDLLEGLIK